MSRRPDSGRPRTELEMVDRLLEHARKGHLGELAGWGTEIRSHGRARADLVLLIEGRIVAVEVKLGDWKRALLQAIFNRFCADYSYVALWWDRVTPAILGEASARGVGVIAVSDAWADLQLEAPPGAPVSTLRSSMKRQVEVAT